MKLNFCLPHETIYKDKDVDQVSAPHSRHACRTRPNGRYTAGGA